MRALLTNKNTLQGQNSNLVRNITKRLHSFDAKKYKKKSVKCSWLECLYNHTVKLVNILQVTQFHTEVRQPHKIVGLSLD